jgi:hypothetical protein
MIAPTGAIITLSIFWFILFWLVGGVAFAIVALLRVIKLRNTRFSCLFTLACAGAAFGAAWSGLTLGESSIGECLSHNDSFFDQLISVFGCGVLEISFSALLWFFGLIVAGFFLMLISRGAPKAWTDVR